MIRRYLFAALTAGLLAFSAFSAAAFAAPPLIEALQVSPPGGVLFLASAFLAVTAAAVVVVALGLVSAHANTAISRALGLDFPAPQTGTPELTSSAAIGTA